MGRRSTTSQDVDGEPAPHGPLAPWRFSLAVGASFVLTGIPLIHAVSSREGLDLAVMRSLGAAAFVWVVLGGINRVLATAEAERAASARVEAQVQTIMASMQAAQAAADASSTSATDPSASQTPTATNVSAGDGAATASPARSPLA
jgi:hypothetical protein